MSGDHSHLPVRQVAITLLALTAFAANSILCRRALGPGHIDAASFTAIRVASGAIVLWILASKGRFASYRPTRNWVSAVALFLYAILFSFAYHSLTVGTGALILFACVQITMIGVSWLSGERPRVAMWLGLICSAGGLVYLVLPGVERPDSIGAISMAGSGCAWGIYSLRGKQASDPLLNTADNFIWAVPFAVATLVFFGRTITVDQEGFWLAVSSGAVASGLGYVVWYQALRHLSGFIAAMVQLSVPIIAALGGIVFLGESVSVRLFVAGLLILGGILIAVVAQSKPLPKNELAK